MPGFDEPLRGQLPDGLITPATIYLIKLCYCRCIFVGVSACRVLLL